MNEVPVFRAPKRRKFAKATNAETPPESTTPVRSDDDGLSSQVPSDDEAPAAFPRLKKSLKPSRLGVTFTSNDRSHAEDESGLALVPVDTANDRLKDVANRFVGTTGQVVDVDRHMMAYIDSEMAKRRQPALPTIPPNTTTVESIKSSPQAPDTQPAPPTKEPQRQHQLAEVDLPPDTATAPPPPKRQRRPRLGRDGRPLRPRRPARRNSSDLARDALVEQVMHEHRLDHYQEPAAGAASLSSSTIPPTQPEPHANTSTSTGAATDRSTPTTTTTTGQARTNDDEAFALRFQREFEEGLAERQALQPQRRKKEGEDKDKDKGPRLGGSRSARAKMVAMREAEKEKSKTGRS